MGHDEIIRGTTQVGSGALTRPGELRLATALMSRRRPRGQRLTSPLECIAFPIDYWCMSSRLISVLSFVSFAAIATLSQTGVAVQGADDSWTILLRGKGAISTSTTRQDLVTRYGDANVTDQEIDVGEGETESGTVLFADDKKRTITILWNDAEAKASPKFVILREKGSLWRTAHGVSIGTSLRELERINGRPFTLSGLGWDYEGTVMSWNDGALEKEFQHNGRVIVRLAPSAAGQVDLDKLAGDRPFSSANPIMQRVNPQIYEIMWEFQQTK